MSDSPRTLECSRPMTTHQDEPERRSGPLADELASSVATFVRSLDLGAPVVLEHFCLVPLSRGLLRSSP